ncbi:MAG: Fe-S cluster assembly protein SufD [Acidimicrobiia bacterium]
MVPLTRQTSDSIDASVPVSGRAGAWELYEGLPVPTGADELWRYVDPDLDPTGYSIVETPGSSLPADPFLNSIQASAGAAIIDGRVATLNGPFLAAGVEVLGLIPPSIDKFAAGHLAFVSDGVVVDVPKGAVVTDPIVVDVQAVTDRAISFPHVTIKLAVNSEASIVLFYRGPSDVSSVVVPQVEVDLADGAHLRLMTVQELGLETYGVVQLRARLARDASFRLGEAGLGGKLGRLDLGVGLDGQGSSAEVIGLFFGHRDQVLDYRINMTHRGRKSTSEVLLKGAVEDQAQSVFAGLVRIEKPAMGSSAFETNRNLVLSPEAKAHSVPILEILCDDVMCGHGSSVGPLEEDHLYYLQSRGLSRPRAERLLVRGFFGQVLDRLPIKGLQTALAEVLDRRFIRAELGAGG